MLGKMDKIMVDKDRLDEQEAELARLREVNAELIETLKAARGYILNGMIDLRTGAKKETAENTLKGGFKMINDVLAKAGEAK